MKFDYDASGNRISKKVTPKTGNSTTTYYLRDASGNVMSTYETTGSSSLTLAEQYLYGSSRLGVLKNGARSYELTDHLGNVRAVVDEFKEVRAAYEYYAFGMSLAKFEGSEGYRYGFNGQERETELTSSHTSAEYWMYDSRLGRRWNVDPKPVVSFSSYSCFGGNPISNTDPLGDSLVKVKIENSNYVHGKKSIYIDHTILPKVYNLLDFAEKNKVHIKLNSAFRTTLKQGNIKGVKTGVKPAKPGTSIHNAGAAFDFALYKDNKPNKNYDNIVDPSKDDLITKFALKEGWTWGATFPDNYDPIHFDLRGSIDKNKLIKENQSQINGDNEMEVKDSYIKREIRYQPMLGVIFDSEAKNKVNSNKTTLPEKPNVSGNVQLFNIIHIINHTKKLKGVDLLPNDYKKGRS